MGGLSLPDASDGVVKRKQEPIYPQGDPNKAKVQIKKMSDPPLQNFQERKEYKNEIRGRTIPSKKAERAPTRVGSKSMSMVVTGWI